jgi:hypothetical protein
MIFEQCFRSNPSTGDPNTIMETEKPKSGSVELSTTAFFEQALEKEVKAYRVLKREQRVRSLTDLTLMLLTILITVLVATYLL